MDIKRRVLTAAFLFVSAGVQACPSQQAPEQRLQAALQAKPDIAIVTVETDTQQEKPASAFAILKVVEGWGRAKRRHLTYSREEAPCVPLEKLAEGGRYAVLLQDHKVTELFEYSAVKKSLKPLGKPDYRYDRKGVLKIAAD